MDPEIGFVELGQQEHDPSMDFFHTDLEQRIGMIGSGILIVVCFIAILYLVLKIRQKDRQRRKNFAGEQLASGGMFDRNIEMVAAFPYAQLSNSES